MAERANFAGTGKLWFNGTIFSEAAKVTATIGGKLNRQVTLGLTGETTEDPTMMELKIEGAPLKSDSLLDRLHEFRRSGRDVGVKLQIGSRVLKGRGKIGPIEEGTENGKSTFSTTVMGDEQA